MTLRAIVRPRLTGTVKIYDAETMTLIKTVRNNITSTQSFIQYAQTGGVVSDYSYLLSVLQNGIIATQVYGGLVYVPSGSGFTARFSFFLSGMPGGTYDLQLSVSSTFPLMPFAYVYNVSIPSNKTLLVEWDIDVSTLPNDFFSPYLIMALLGATQYTVLPPNAQYAFQQISSGNYLMSPPSYYVTYNGNYISVNPQFSRNSIYINYIYIPNSSQTLTNLGIVVTGVNSYVDLVLPLSSASVTIGQYVAFVYSATWTHS